MNGLLEGDEKDCMRTFNSSTTMGDVLCSYYQFVGVSRAFRKGDIIDSVRQGIKYIVASERRLNVFSDIAKRLDLGCNKLILDVPTRWNSTYLMLKTAIRFKEVFPRYHRVEQAFLWVISPEQWDKVENVNKVLAVFNDVTNVVSVSDYPTSNLFLPEVCRMKEIVDIKAVDRNEYIRLMAAKMSDKFDKYWGESNMVMTLAAVLDPRYKMKLIRFCFPIIYPLDVRGDNIKAVLNTLKELFEVYVAAHNASIIQQQAAAEVSAATTTVASVTEVVSGGRSRFRQHVRSNDIIRPIKTDLDVYLEEDVFIFDSENGEDSDAKFDALGW
ncbi:zinc finger BED domain-containing protein RICESLEEPER 2-like [Corylus avellana]|uniref:zinc finger BED domain-containing protein RICESLEEPER 2-like n=1 Tax=Corylus avellana TaxID=13451 RepID=UPI00286C7144|nr:zinc finger BED domain-containing protein RICESLEEPER 2-like [Corylus avellana]